MAMETLRGESNLRTAPTVRRGVIRAEYSPITLPLQEEKSYVFTTRALVRRYVLDAQGYINVARWIWSNKLSLLSRSTPGHCRRAATGEWKRVWVFQLYIEVGF